MFDRDPFGHNFYLEEEIDFRGDTVMLEVSEMHTTQGPWVEYQVPEWCYTMYVFKLYAYSELNQNYEVDITDTLTAEENLEMQKKIDELAADQAASYAEGD
jgi:hypothetical protein